MPALTICAGAGAYRQLRAQGFDPAKIKAMFGASGGPKWLGLYHLDRAILSLFADWYKGRTDPLALIGSSIGTWRFAAYAQADPIAAFDRLWQNYAQYRWDGNRDPDRMTRDSDALLAVLLGQNGPSEILSHPHMRLHIATTRSRHLAGSRKDLVVAAAILATAAGNAISRRTLRYTFQRCLVSDPRQPVPGEWGDFPPLHVELTEANLAQSLSASCAIPFLFNPVQIEGAPPGMYRDGGIIDYHFNTPLLPGDSDGIVFYPHFSTRLAPGWFDKRLKRREMGPAARDRLLLVAPSDEFLASLPMGKIPDREDFKRLSNDDRINLWQRTVAETERMAEDFYDQFRDDRFIDRMELL